MGFSKETTAHSQLFTSQHLSHASWSLPEFGSFGRAAWLTSISPVPVNQQHKVEVNLAGAIDSLVAQCPPVMMVTERKFTEAEWASTRTMGVGCSSWTKPVVQRNVPSAVDFLVVIFFDKPQKMVVQELKPSVDDDQQVISSSTEGTGVDKLDDGGVGTTDFGEEEDESKSVLVTEVLGAAAAAAATLGFEIKHNLTTENLILNSTTQMPDFSEVLTAEKLATEKLTSTAGETSSTSEVILTTEVFPTTEAQVDNNFFQYLTTTEQIAIFPDSTKMSTVNESTSFLLESTSFLSESTNYTTTSTISPDLALNSTTASFTTVLDANSSSSTVEASSTALPDDQTTVLFPLAESESTSVLDTDSSINQTERTTFQTTKFQTSNSTTESLVTITEENSTTESEATIKDETSTVDSVAVSDGNSSVESVVTITADENSTTESVVATTTDENSTLETLEMINADENSTTTTQTPNITTETEQLQHNLETTALDNSSTKLPIPTSSSSTTNTTTTATIPTTTTVQNEATAVHLSPETTTLPPTKTTTAKIPANITTTTKSLNSTSEKPSTSSETPTSTNFPLHHHHHHHVPCSPEYIHHLINFLNQVRNYRHQRQLTLSAKLSKSANLLAQLPAEGIDLPFSASFGTIVYHKRKDLLNNNNSSSSNNSTEAKCNFTDAVMAIYASRLRPMLKGGRPFSHEQWDQAAEVGVGCYIFDNEEAGRTELHVVFTFAIPKGAFN